MSIADWSKPLGWSTVSRMSRTGDRDVAVAMRGCGISTTSQHIPFVNIFSMRSWPIKRRQWKHRYNNRISLKVKWQTAKWSLERKKSQGRRDLSRDRLFQKRGCRVVKMSSAEQSIDVSDNVVPSTPVVDEDVSLVSSGHRDHSVDAREGSSVVPERADVAPERAVPGGPGSHCGRPRGKGLRPGYTISKRHPQREQTPQMFSESESGDESV